jgi:hypothetical protein
LSLCHRLHACCSPQEYTQYDTRDGSGG